MTYKTHGLVSDQQKHHTRYRGTPEQSAPWHGHSTSAHPECYSYKSLQSVCLLGQVLVPCLVLFSGIDLTRLSCELSASVLNIIDKGYPALLKKCRKKPQAHKTCSMQEAKEGRIIRAGIQQDWHCCRQFSQNRRWHVLVSRKSAQKACTITVFLLPLWILCVYVFLSFSFEREQTTQQHRVTVPV